MARITQIKDHIVSVKGNEKFRLFQFFNFGNGISGFVLSAKGDEAKMLVSGSVTSLKINQEVSIGIERSIVADAHFFGKIINTSGEVIFVDEKSKTSNKTNHLKKITRTSTLFNDAPTILDRLPIVKPLDTGMIAIDAMIPIGRGQRELIIGDRATGKSTIAVNTLINTATSPDGPTINIYVAIGQKKADVMAVYELLKSHDALNHTIIIYANPDSPAEQFMAPMYGLAIAEAIAYSGNDVVVILDDLSKHANVYREISLSVDRNPGREAYPNDIFYLHSRLLERGGRFNAQYGDGSITILPIVETIEGDIASLIPSNIISITDGQIFTSTNKFNKGIFPAIDVQMSVSRTGSAAQSPIIKLLSKSLRADHAQFEEVKKFVEISVNINDSLGKVLKKATQLDQIIEQYGHQGYSRELMAFFILLYRDDALVGNFVMRDLAKATRAYMTYDVTGRELYRRLGKIDQNNEQQVAFNARLLLPDLVAGLHGDFGRSISRVEWEKMMTGGQ